MSRGYFTRVMPVTGIVVSALGIGLAVTACGPATSSTAAGTAGTKTAASTPATAVASPPASTPSASVSNAQASSAPASRMPAKKVAPSSAPATAPSSAPAPTPRATATTPIPIDGPFVLWQCNTNKPLVRPAYYVLACGDGGNGLTGVRWTNWTPAGATGAGTEYLNACIPNCAEGKIIDYPVDIALTGSYLAAQGDPFSYAKITLTYLAARPLIYVTVHGKVVLTHPASWSPPLPQLPASHLPA